MTLGKNEHTPLHKSPAQTKLEQDELRLAIAALKNFREHRNSSGFPS